MQTKKSELTLELIKDIRCYKVPKKLYSYPSCEINNILEDVYYCLCCENEFTGLKPTCEDMYIFLELMYKAATERETDILDGIYLLHRNKYGFDAENDFTKFHLENHYKLGNNKKFSKQHTHWILQEFYYKTFNIFKIYLKNNK